MKRTNSRLKDELQVARRGAVRYLKTEHKLGNAEIGEIMKISREAVRKILLKRTK